MSRPTGGSYERIAALAAAGYRSRQIAETVGVCVRTVQRARRVAGVPAPFCGNQLSAEELRRAAAMLDDGASYREVGRTLGRSATAVMRNLRGRSQWKPGSGPQYRKMREALEAIPVTVLIVSPQAQDNA
ncbi:helix-turn-helix domain-containing protein [Mycobacterium malmoense]|uniref:helix-turn-helix domain-containing protein n=1 Tax=Mycobacterium malmoense TaxID=1780 RepID=UPI0008F8266E|nr:helix-turn-helix domain-containing protein [Mycobacterium malmoense]OIN80757.1 hypothetical protein BMG05_10440 [Mycobacterium malmoense]